MNTEQSAIESKRQETRKTPPISPAVRTAESHTIPYSGWKEKGVDGRFYGASKRAVQGPGGSAGFAAVVLERRRVANGLSRRTPTKVVFFPDRQIALETARQWFRQAQNIPEDKDIIKFHATFWARPPKTKMVSANATPTVSEAAITAGDLPSNIVSQIPNPETPKISTETAHAGASVKSQSFWRVLFDLLLAGLTSFKSRMKSFRTLQAQLRRGE